MRKQQAAQRRSDGVRARYGFSMVELVVVMAIVGLLLAIAIPAVVQTRDAARKVQCINNLRNIAYALAQFDHFQGRLPASGNVGHDADLRMFPHHNWAVSVLPHLEQSNLFDQLDLDLPITDPANSRLATAHIPVYICPMDLSRNKEKQGDLSYAVNGGIGFTVRHDSGVRDCPVDKDRTILDLNGDGIACSGTQADDMDRKVFKQLGLFFLETWNTEITRRHHSLADVHDGASQTFLVTENVRVGFAPNDPLGNFANPFAYRTAFYIGSPCPNGDCSAGNVDYSRCNSGDSRINSGLWGEEGRSPAPNSFHAGGVNMAYADAHVSFLAESVDGAIYAALASPQGLLLDETPLAQTIVSGGEF